MLRRVLNKLLTRIQTDYLIIFVIMLVGHGLLLLNDGVYWDDWLYYDALIHKQPQLLQETFNEIGFPLTGYVHQFLGLFPDFLLAYKIFIFVTLFLTAILIYKILEKSALVSRADNLLIVSITLLYPAFRARGLITLAPREFWDLLFFLGFFLSMRAEETTARRRVFYRVAALLCFYFSFTENILLPLYFGFLLLATYLYYERPPEVKRRSFKSFLLRHLDYLLLPLLFWVIKQKFFVPYGPYAGYGSFDVFAAGFYFIEYIIYGVFLPFIYSFLLVKSFIVGGVILALILAWVFWRFKNRLTSRHIPRSAARALLVFGIVWFGLAIFPFAVTAKDADPGFFSSRNLILVPFPMALILVSLTRLISQASHRSSRLLYIGLCWLIVIFGAVTINDYVSLEARWIKDRSVMVNLTNNDLARRTSVFAVSDHFPSDLNEPHRFYEWAFMFRSIWGGESRIGLDASVDVDSFLAENTEFFTAQYGLVDFNPSGCRASLTINSGQPVGKFNLFAGYLYNRFLQPDRLDQFLSQVTTIDLKPIESPNTTC